MIFELISVQDFKELISFKQIIASIYPMIENFFHSYSDIFFQHFSPELMIKAIMILLEGLKMEDTTIKTNACNAIRDLCTFIYETMNKSSEKAKPLKEAI